MFDLILIEPLINIFVPGGVLRFNLVFGSSITKPFKVTIPSVSVRRYRGGADEEVSFSLGAAMFRTLTSCKTQGPSN